MAVREQITGEMFVANREKLRIFVVFCAHILRNLLSSEGLGLECPAVGSEDRGLQTGGKKEGADTAEEVILKIEKNKKLECNLGKPERDSAKKGRGGESSLTFQG